MSTQEATWFSTQDGHAEQDGEGRGSSENYAEAKTKPDYTVHLSE
jgi:hypothetical protein